MNKKLTNNEILEYVKGETNPATEYEIGVLNTISGFNKKASEWRFQKGVNCKQCNRELTILDYFLTGIQHHSLKGIQDFICPDFQKQNHCEHDIDPDLVDKYEITDHPNPIGCVNCGYINQLMHNLYSHPGCKGLVIRMPQETYDMFLSKYNSN